ncbi:unnamed protein product, partial [marine sediment metagenome]
LGKEIKICPDLIVLSTPLIQHKSGEELAKKLRVPLGLDRFFLEAHIKLRPIDFAMDGIFVCGTAHGPKDVPESISQAYGAASRAAIPMANRKVSVEAIYAVVDEDLCIGCRLCEEMCPYGAHEIKEGKSKVVEVLCKGCGSCAAACPRRAISMQHYNDEQIKAQIKAAFQEGIYAKV